MGNVQSMKPVHICLYRFYILFIFSACTRLNQLYDMEGGWCVRMRGETSLSEKDREKTFILHQNQNFLKLHTDWIGRIVHYFKV